MEERRRGEVFFLPLFNSFDIPFSGGKGQSKGRREK